MINFKKTDLDTIIIGLAIVYMFTGFSEPSAFSTALLYIGAILGCVLLLNRMRRLIKGEIKFRLCFYFLIAPILSVWFIASVVPLIIMHFKAGLPLFPQ